MQCTKIPDSLWFYNVGEGESLGMRLYELVLECWQSTDITCARVLAVNWQYMCSSVGSQLTVHVLKCWQSTDSTCARVLAVSRQYMYWSVDSQPTVECWQSPLFPILSSSHSEPADGCVQPLLGERWGHHGLISEPPRQVLSFRWKKHTGTLSVYILVYLCIALYTSCILVN